MTQNEKVLDFIKKNGSITQRQAFDLGIMRLASRISELKKAGFDIVSKSIKVKCRDGENAYVAQYSFRKDIENG